jgi:hypothetical protein
MLACKKWLALFATFVGGIETKYALVNSAFGLDLFLSCR